MSTNFSKAISMMVCERLASLPPNRQANLAKHADLAGHPAQWTHKDYVALAQRMGLSQSFVKRLFGYSGHSPPTRFNANTKRKLLAFFELEKWEDLERQAMAKASGLPTGHQLSGLKKELGQIHKRIKAICDRL